MIWPLLRKGKRAGFVLALFCCCLAGNAGAERQAYESKLGLINPGGFIVFFNSQGPLSYQTLTRGELPADIADLGEVECKSCQHGLSIPVPTSSSRSTSVSGAQGDGSILKAMQSLKKTKPEAEGIYDVKVDMQRISVLGIYRRVCTLVNARAFSFKK